jgi:hypothetical protein
MNVPRRIMYLARWGRLCETSWRAATTAHEPCQESRGAWSEERLCQPAQEKENQWAIENNLAHLLEHTPGLKTLIVVANTEAKFASFGLTHTHPCMLKLQMACSLCDARMQRQVIRACIVRMPCSLTTSALGRSGGDHKTV